jgi:hypothetical protein
MSAEVRPWDPFLCESAKMVCTNRLDLVPARTLLDALYHQTSFITIRCFLETRYRSMSYIITFGLLAIDVRNGTSFLLKDHLEDAFSARVWTKSDIGPRCPDWACIANIRPKDRPQISGFWPRLMRQSETSRGIWRSLSITCSQPNGQSN